MTNKKDVISKSAKKPSRPTGRKTPMPDGKRNLLITGAIIVMVIISVSLAYAVQKPTFKPPAAPSTAETPVPADNSSGTTPPVSVKTDIPGAKVAVNSDLNSSTAAPANSYVPFQPPAGEAKRVALDTDRGQIVVEVYPTAMPQTVANFLKLVDSKFYNGLTFHRVEDWVIQGGDPKGDGTGGPGWTIPLEKDPAELKNVRGAVAMARSQDPNSAGSQFYILKKDSNFLDGQYAVFGQVVKGMEVVDQMQKGDKMKTVVPYAGK